MNVIDWLKEVAYLKFVPMKNHLDEDIPKSWLSKFDDSYITFEGLENTVRYLADHEITEQLTHGVGFSPKYNKWYGWSHRAIYGFTIGSTCKKGDCHYRPKNKEDFLEQMIIFWSDSNYTNIKAEHTQNEIMYSVPINPGEAEQKSIPSGKFESGVYVSWTYNNKTPNKKIRGTISGIFTPYPKQFGKGEWIAETMEDAKQMAIDFNEDVS